MTLCQTIPPWDVKRLLEYYLADPEFLDRLREDPLRAAEELGLSWDPTRVQKLWDPQAPERDFLPDEVAYREQIKERMRLRDQIREEGTPDDPRYRAWRARQQARVKAEVGPVKAESIIHAPMAFELSQGCSVGCWFCAISAEKLQAYFPYTDENRDLWRGTLRVFQKLMGRAARWGFCYWATDPLDNPDYEKFCIDFHETLGMFPQTTTAMGHKDPARTRALLALSQERGCAINRFSVLTLGLFRKVFQEFTAEELHLVECLPQNRESRVIKSQAGKARERAIREAEKEGRSFADDAHAGTIACVSGFLINMVERRVRVVSPCRANERWPLGYYVHAEGRFKDTESLERLVEDMVRQAMPSQISELPIVRPAWFATHQEVENGFSLSSDFLRITLADPLKGPYLQRLGHLVAEGRSSASTLATLLFYEFGVPESRTLSQLQSIFEQGFLDEEPQV